jgi:hypothetical protein
MLPAEKIVERNWVEERKRQKPSNKTAMVPERKNKPTCGFQRQPKVGRNLGSNDRGWLLIKQA